MRKAQLATDRADTRSERAAAANLLETASFQYYQTMATSMIESVDGITDHDNIMEWVSVLPIPYRREMLQLFESIEAWGPPTSVKIQCRDCQEVVDATLDLNPVSFFT
jgi:hypothetical protein